jgi:elongation factor 1-beta
VANVEKLLPNTDALNVHLKDQIEEKMGTAIVTLKIMPESPEIDLKKIEKESLKLITAFSDDRQKKVVVEPVAFGLKSVSIIFLMDEKKGDTETLEKQISDVEGVNSVECTDVRRTLG